MYVFIFWVILALLYLSLAIFTYKTGRPLLDQLEEVHEGTSHFLTEDSKEIKDDKGNVITIGSTTHKFFKAIITTDIIGFVLASIAALIS